MTTLGKLIKGATVTIPGVGQFPNSTVIVTPAGRANGKASATPLDIPSLTAQLISNTITASALSLGSPPAILASLTAWTQQDDDAHEPCSLTACRTPLHPGPCKGWK